LLHNDTNIIVRYSAINISDSIVSKGVSKMGDENENNYNAIILICDGCHERFDDFPLFDPNLMHISVCRECNEFDLCLNCHEEWDDDAYDYEQDGHLHSIEHQTEIMLYRDRYNEYLEYMNNESDDSGDEYDESENDDDGDGYIMDHIIIENANNVDHVAIENINNFIVELQQNQLQQHPD
jgi:hypothetical protein